MLKRHSGSRNLGLNRANVEVLEVESDPLESVVSYNKAEPLHLNYGKVSYAPSPLSMKKTAVRSKSPTAPLRKLTMGGRRRLKSGKHRRRHTRKHRN
jgi:hypothetical protein